MHESYITYCCYADGEAINAMMDKARPITYRTFARLMGRQRMAALHRWFGYDYTGFTIKSDWALSFYTATWEEKPVLIFQHSRIEYIFRRSTEP